MTLVQASIADNGKSVILCADRLLTSTLGIDLPSYEFEAKEPKIIYRGNVGLGFAGSSFYADKCISQIRDETDFEKIVETVSIFMITERKKVLDKYIEKVTGVNSQDFFTKSDLAIPPEVREGVYYTMKEFNMDCNSIIAGFDEHNKARIVFVDHDGEKYDTTSFHTFSIGSGSSFSKIYFDQLSYSPSMSTKEAMLFAFEAKKWAQAHTGVGQRDDMILFKMEKNNEISVIESNDDSQFMERMHKIYEKEIKIRERTRKQLLKELFKEEVEI